jgi:uncharacterized repeat protein (TIGR01451 family)
VQTSTVSGRWSGRVCTSTRTLVDDRTNIVSATGYTAQRPDVPVSDVDDADVVVLIPSIEITKTAGDAEDGDVLETTTGPVTYTYVVKNDGDLTLFGISVTDDAGTPADESDDFTADCPASSLAPGASMTCTFTVDVAVDTINTAVASGVTPRGSEVDADDDAEVVILHHGLFIDKSNDAALVSIELADGTIVDLPTAEEGSTVTFSLVYDLLDDPVTNAVITDELPAGLTYVDGSATGDFQFSFVGYHDATRTLTWTAATVIVDGAVSYQATVDVDAAELQQPLVNVATIASDQSDAISADSEVYVPTIPAAVTGTPKPTLPPTDTMTAPAAAAGSGSGLWLALLALGGIVLLIGFVTPVPSSVRQRSRR